MASSDVKVQEIQFQGVFPLSTKLATGTRFVLRILSRKLERLPFSFLRFRHGSGVSLPQASAPGEHIIAGLSALPLVFADKPELELILVGHASAPGSPAHNQKLSQARADSTFALLQGEEKLWVDAATDFGSLEDIKGYLAYLTQHRGWDCDPGPIEGQEETAASRAGVSRFQEQYNEDFTGELGVDGACGPKTLGAIFQVLRIELDEAVQTRGGELSQIKLREPQSTFGASNLFLESIASPDEDDHRVVDAFCLNPAFFQEGELNPETIYQADLTKAVDLPVAPLELGDMHAGAIVLLTDIEFEHAEEAAAVFILRSDSGFEKTVVPWVEGINNEGFVEIRFENISKRLNYSIVARYASGAESMLVEDKSYFRLTAESSSLDEDVVHPFTGAKEE